MPAETLEKVVGRRSPAGEGPINVGPYVRYLKSKFGEIYGVS
jgi:hypothetical protein